MNKAFYKFISVVIVVGIFAFPLWAKAQTPDHTHHHPSQTPSASKQDADKSPTPTIPDLEVLNQDGKRVKFYSDLVKGKVVGINFIFTTCTTICPPMGATYGNLQKLFGDRLGREVYLISISVDPVTDTPERLKAWAAKFHARPGWTLVTGDKSDINKILSALGGYTAQKEDHSPVMLVGNDAVGMWSRIYGLANPSKIAGLFERLTNAPTADHSAGDHTGMVRENPKAGGSHTPVNNAARNYFSDVTLINQNGESMRFYSDLLKGKVVVINSFFTSCTSVCPPMIANISKIQKLLGDRLGKEINLISITVDPETDTPPRLKEYAEKFSAKPGWYFLTGKKANVEWALYKLGQYVDNRDSHSTLIIVGNEPTGLWKKALALANVSEIIRIIDDVADDKL